MRILMIRTVIAVMMKGRSCENGILAWADLDSDEEDENAQLIRELEKIKKERAEQRAKEVNLQPWKSLGAPMLILNE